MLVKMQVFRDIGLNVFEQPWVPTWNKYQGEDWSMCAAMERAGYDIWVDHDLSQVVGHLGTFEFAHDVVEELPLETTDGCQEDKVQIYQG